MSIYDLMSSDMTSIVTRDGASVTYTPYGGEAQTINILYSIRQEFSDIEGEYMGAVLEAVVDKSDIASPKPNDTITLNSEVWTVRPPIMDGISGFNLECTKDERKRY